MDERKWRIVWASWAAFFAVAETVALRSGHDHAPLSHHMRHVFGVNRQSPHRRLGQLAYASGVAWLAVHLWKAAAGSGVETNGGE